MDLGTRIQTLRKEKGLSQEALAAQLGVSRQAIGKWETGSCIPSIDNLLELSSIFSVTVDELLTGNPPASPQPDAVSLDSLRQLTQPPRRRIWPIFLGAALLCVGLFSYTLYETAALKETVSSLQNRLYQVEAAVQNSTALLQAPEYTPSLFSSWDYVLGDYDPAARTAMVTFTATPKAITRDTALTFLLSPGEGDPISAEAQLAADGCSFTAQIAVPIVPDFTITAALTQDGVRQTEFLIEETTFSENYLTGIYADSSTFSWHSAWGNVTCTGAPEVTIVPPLSPAAPQPETLTGTLFMDGEAVYTETLDISPLSGTSSQDSAIQSSYYFYLEDLVFPCEGEPALSWVFTVTDTLGGTAEATLP